MAKLAYTPTSLQNWRGHPRRIYFSCHPDDRGLYDRIASDVRAVTKDCVIAYLDEDADADVTVPVDELENFHLVIFAVTLQWLSAPSRSADREFAFATDRHMAVLPILFDDASMDVFNAKAKGVQGLRASDKEYTEKLDRALHDTLLVDESLLEQVKGVFTHRMFISYCQQDAEQTKQLLRVIHKREAFRRIAVWYDKYIPAGRYFEDIIFSALDSCDIFSMAITPSLVHRPTDSYVLTTELPYAVEQSKKILCFETGAMAAEEKSVLFAKCEQRRTALDAYPYVPMGKDHRIDERAVEKAIAVCLGKGERQTTVEEDYLLGLAYLNGISVEFDFKYALKKFEKAAAAGHLEAVEQLVNMYRYGRGVTLSLKQAIHWRTVAVSITKKRFEQARKRWEEHRALFFAAHLSADLEAKRTAVGEANVQAVNEYVGCLLQLSDLLRDVGDYPAASKPCATALAVWDEAQTWHGSDGTQTARAWSSRMEMVGRLCLLDASSDCADVARTRNAWEESRAQYAKTPDNTRVIEQAVNHGRMYAEVLTDNRCTDGAREVLDEVAEIARKLEYGTTMYYTLMISFYRHYGMTYLVEKDGVSAEAYLAEALRLSEEASLAVYEENPGLRSLATRVSLDLGQALLLSISRMPSIPADQLKSSESLFQHAFVCLAMAMSRMEEEEALLGEVARKGERAIAFLQEYFDVFYWVGYGQTMCGVDRTSLRAWLECLKNVYRRFEFLREASDPQHRVIAREKLDSMRDAIVRWEKLLKE